MSDTRTPAQIAEDAAREIRRRLNLVQHRDESDDRTDHACQECVTGPFVDPLFKCNRHGGLQIDLDRALLAARWAQAEEAVAIMGRNSWAGQAADRLRRAYEEASK